MRGSWTAAILLLTMATCRANGETILSISGENVGGSVIGGLLDPDHTYVTGFTFTLTKSYANVQIVVPLMKNDASQDQVTAYLVGGGLPQPATSQIATSGLTVTEALFARSYTVFSGLDLAAGTYSLVLDSATSTGNNLGWQYSLPNDSSTPAGFETTVVADDGVTFVAGGLGSLNDGLAAYAPNSPNFQTIDDVMLNITITGDPVVTAVPEPSSFAAAAFAVAIGLGLAARRPRGTKPVLR